MNSLRAGIFLFLAGFVSVLAATNVSLLDPTFSLQRGGGTALALQPDGKILVAGNLATPASSNWLYLVRLHSDGQVDTTFPAPGLVGPNHWVEGIQVQDDGKIIIGGEFTTINRQPALRLARLHPDGRLDTTFQPPQIDYLRPGSYSDLQKILLTKSGLIIAVHFSLDNTVRLYRLRENGSIDESFTANLQPEEFRATVVRGLAEQPDGRLLVAGDFISAQGQQFPGLVRLEANGAVDTTFQPEIPAGTKATAFALQDDGRIVVAAGHQSGSYLLRLNRDGKRDDTFALSEFQQESIYGLGLRSDGRIVATGSLFMGINPDGTRDMTSDPILDIRFPPGAIAIQDDNKVLAVGMALSNSDQSFLVARFKDRFDATNSIVYFAESEQYVWENAGRAVLKVVRSGDPRFAAEVTFSTQNKSEGSDIAYTPTTGRVAFGPAEGEKTIEIPLLDNEIIADRHQFIVTLTNSDPDLVIVRPVTVIDIIDDNALKQPPQFYFHRTNHYEISENDRTISFLIRSLYSENVPYGTEVSVRYTLVSGTAREGEDFPAQTGVIPFYKSHGWRWESLIGGVTIEINDDAIAEGLETFSIVLSEPKGGFVIPTNQFATVTILDNDNPNGAARGANDAVHALAGLPDGKVIAVGDFTSIDGITRKRVARLNPDVSVDTTWNPSGVDGPLAAVAVQTNGSILVGGQFSSIGGIARTGIARLLPTGEVDLTFDASQSDQEYGPASYIYSIAVQPDGKILLGGDFGVSNGTSRTGLRRLNSDGTYDTSFKPPSGSYAAPIVLQRDGKILVGGWYPPAGGVVRLHSSGALDRTLNLPAPLGFIRGITVLPEGWIFLGTGGGVAKFRADGSLDSTYRVIAAAGALTLVMQPDGKILAAAANHIWRVVKSGYSENGFYVEMSPEGYAPGVVLQPNGEIIIAGNFNTVNGKPRRRLARLSANGKVLEPATLAQPAISITGESLLRLTGLSTWPLVLQKSTNLLEWHTLHTLTNLEGTVEFRDSIAGPRGFYRIQGAP